jgi:hypothetical protein
MTDDLLYITYFKIEGYIYGYYYEDDAQSLYNKLFQNIPHYDFDSVLVNANLKNLGINSGNFIEIFKAKKYTKYDQKEYLPSRKGPIKGFRFMQLANYTIKNVFLSQIFASILKMRINNTSNNLSGNVFMQGPIYISFTITSENIFNNDDINNKTSFKKYIRENLNDKKNLYNEYLDTIGTRLYYLMENELLKLVSRKEDMKNSAVSIGNSNKYKAEKFEEFKKIKQIDYDEFLESIEKFFEEYYVVDFIYPQ